MVFAADSDATNVLPGLFGYMELRRAVTQSIHYWADRGGCFHVLLESP